MAFWKRDRPAPERITAEALATYGRNEFLRADPSIDTSGNYQLIRDLVHHAMPTDGPGFVEVVAELRRHAAKGEWEKVGAWMFIRDMCGGDVGSAMDLVDGGLAAVIRMRVTNLRFHLSGYDSDRYRELTGEAAPHDGFFGPPVFDSDFGPSKQYYFDHAVAAAAGRRVTRLSTQPGKMPGPVDDAASCMWDFAMLVYKGPLLVGDDYRFEPNVIRPAVTAATGVDHCVFVEALAAAVGERELDTYVKAPWYSLGATRFVEDYLDFATVDEPAYGRLLDAGLTQLVEFGALGVTLSPEVLTPRQRDRIQELGLWKP